MVRYCSFPRCFHKSNKIQGLSFHQFPRDKLRREEWLKAAGRRGWNPGTFCHLCSAHFRKEDFNPQFSCSRRLRIDSVPSIFPTHIQRLSNEGHLIERLRVNTVGSRQYISENREKLQCDDSACIDPSQFMTATMDVEENGLDISTLSSKMLPQRFVLSREDRFNHIPAGGQVNERQRQFPTIPNGKQMPLLKNQACSQAPKAPSTQARPLNTMNTPVHGAHPGKAHLSSTRSKTILETIIKLILKSERSLIEQSVVMNSAIQLMKSLLVKEQPRTTN